MTTIPSICSNGFRVGDFVIHTAPSTGQQIRGRITDVCKYMPHRRILVETLDGAIASLFPSFCTKIPKGWN